MKLFFVSDVKNNEYFINPEHIIYIDGMSKKLYLSSSESFSNNIDEIFSGQENTVIELSDDSYFKLIENIEVIDFI